MNKSVMTLGLALASLLSAQALAQKDVPGEARALPVFKASPEEASAARETLRADAVQAARVGYHADAAPEPMGWYKAAAPAERAAARDERKAMGAAAAREEKDHGGMN